MKKEECEYWDNVAEIRIKKAQDNPWKRREILKRVLRTDFIFKRVLEIGVGIPQIAASLYYTLNGAFQYAGTDVSKRFVDSANEKGFKVFHTDIKNLPEGPFDIIMALDTLEHVHPDDRDEGYKEIGRVMGNKAKILLNIPVEETKHDTRYDHDFGFEDVLKLGAATNSLITQWELYHATGKRADNSDIDIRYVWAELER